MANANGGCVYVQHIDIAVLLHIFLLLLLLLLCFHFIWFCLPPSFHMLLDSFIIFRIYFTVLFVEGSECACFGEISIGCILFHILEICWDCCVCSMQSFVDSFSTLTIESCLCRRRSLQVACVFFHSDERYCCLFLPSKRIHSHRNGNFDFLEKRDPKSAERKKETILIWLQKMCVDESNGGFFCV